MDLAAIYRHQELIYYVDAELCKLQKISWSNLKLQNICCTWIELFDHSNTLSSAVDLHLVGDTLTSLHVMMY